MNLDKNFYKKIHNFSCMQTQHYKLSRVNIHISWTKTDIELYFMDNRTEHEPFFIPVSIDNYGDNDLIFQGKDMVFHSSRIDYQTECFLLYSQVVHSVELHQAISDFVDLVNIAKELEINGEIEIE